jgi:hypothetical protein
MSFRNVLRSAWTSIKRAAAPYGISGGDTGSTSAQGFSFAWTYNEAAKTLHIQCLESRLAYPCAEINRLCNNLSINWFRRLDRVYAIMR